MNIIIPMAGRGTRLRPHTITIPKPLLPVAGKPIVQRLVEDIVKTLNTKIENIGFIIGDFGADVPGVNAGRLTQVGDAVEIGGDFARRQRLCAKRSDQGRGSVLIQNRIRLGIIDRSRTQTR